MIRFMKIEYWITYNRQKCVRPRMTWKILCFYYYRDVLIFFYGNFCYITFWPIGTYWASIYVIYVKSIWNWFLSLSFSFSFSDSPSKNLFIFFFFFGVRVCVWRWKMKFDTVSKGIILKIIFNTVVYTISFHLFYLCLGSPQFYRTIFIRFDVVFHQSPTYTWVWIG